MASFSWSFLRRAYVTRLSPGIGMFTILPLFCGDGRKGFALLTSLRK
ncbi:hypothetical protein LINGRAHAP2_LOCUS29590 [Linum grandiflorum]